jgi:PTH1 family peptidyl-tRNA hydrolase
VIRLVLGLGNPGAQYARTRHNAGIWFAESLRDGASWSDKSSLHASLARVQYAGCALLLARTLVYMNQSGMTAQAVLRYHRLETGAMLVAHDDLDLPCGTVRLKWGGGDGGHLGLRDISRLVGPEYWRLRLGIGRPPRGGDVRAFVLGEPNAEEQRAMTEAIERGRKGLAHLLCEEVDQAHLAVQGINPAQGTA